MTLSDRSLKSVILLPILFYIKAKPRGRNDENEYVNKTKALKWLNKASNRKTKYRRTNNFKNNRTKHN